MRERLLQLAQSKQVIAINFPAAAGGKLLSANGTIKEVGEDHMVMQDIYGNVMIVPFTSIAYIEVKK